MPFPELVISNTRRSPGALPARADIAVFVGLVARRAALLPQGVRAALIAAGWAGTGPFARTDAAVEALLDVPVPVSSWGEFDELYAWDDRPLSDRAPGKLPCALGLAVRSFFAEGGAKAWIVRTGDPLPLLIAKAAGESDADFAARLAAARRLQMVRPETFLPANSEVAASLMPGLGTGTGMPTPGDPASWTGAAHIWGIDDAAMLVLPDLPELHSGVPLPLADPPLPPAVPEQFKPCDTEPRSLDTDAPNPFVPVQAARLNRAGYDAWALAIHYLLDLLGRPRGPAHRRDVMLIASLPLPRSGGEGLPNDTATAPFVMLDEQIVVPPVTPQGVERRYRLTDADRIGSARLQLAYPWVETEASAAMPERLQGGDGVLAGVIARSALAKGAFRSAAGQPLASVRRAVPDLPEAALRRAAPDGRADWLGDRLSLFGTKFDGPVLLSDATMAAGRGWRAGGVSRLSGIVLRAARWLGQERLFEPSGPALWASVEADFDGFMEELLRLGALAGATPREAFDVRCDASTMSQADIDAGRVVIQIAFTAAQPIQRISVTLTLNEGGQLPLQVAA